MLLSIILSSVKHTYGQLDTIAQFSRVNTSNSKYERSYMISSKEILVESININKSVTIFEKFDGDFNVVNKLELPPHPGTKKLSATNGEFIYKIYFTTDLKYYCYTVNKYTFEVKLLEGKLPKEMPSSSFITNGKVCVFETYNVKVTSYPVLDFRTGKFEEIPIQIPDMVKPKIISTAGSQVFPNNEMFLYYDVYAKGEQTPVLLQLNEDGEIIATHKFSTNDSEFRPHDALITHLSGDTYLITGQWYKSKLRKLDYTGEGVFVAKIENGKTEFFRTYEYADIKNLYNHKSRANNDHSGDKLKLISARVDFNNYKLDSTSILITGPVYEKEVIKTNINGNIRTTTSYLYYQGITLSFNLKGELQWSESYAIGFNKAIAYPMEFVSYWDLGSDFLLIANTPLSTRTVLMSKEGEVIEEKQIQEIYQRKGNFEVPSYPYKVYKWVGDYFILFGTVENKEAAPERINEKTKYVMYKLKVSE